MEKVFVCQVTDCDCRTEPGTPELPSGGMRERSGTEEKVKFQRKLSRVVEGLGCHAQGTLKVLQRYYAVAEEATDSERGSDAGVSAASAASDPLTSAPSDKPRRKRAVHRWPYENLTSGEWLRKLADAQETRSPSAPRKSSGLGKGLVGCVATAVERSGLRHLLLLSALFAYTLLGGLAVYHLEARPQHHSLQPPPNRTRALASACTRLGYTLSKSRSEAWSYGDAVFYSFVTITTIGYGERVCKTTEGKVFTIFYMVFGIPLLFMTLSDIGRFLLRQLQRLVERCRRLCRDGGRLGWVRSRTNSALLKGKRGLAEEAGLAELDLLPALISVFVYIFLSAGLFCALEPEWSYFTSLYFVFVSLSTVGFGDVVPGSPREALAASLVFLVGLSLVSLCINVVQRRMELKYLGALRVMEVAYQTSLQAAKTGSFRRRGSRRPHKTIAQGLQHQFPSFTSLPFPAAALPHSNIS